MEVSTHSRNHPAAPGSCQIGNIVDDSQEMVDDILDRARDAEEDLRSIARKAPGH